MKEDGAIDDVVKDAGVGRWEAEEGGEEEDAAEKEGDEAGADAQKDGESGEEQPGAGQEGGEEMEAAGEPGGNEAEVADMAGVLEFLDAEGDEGESEEEASQGEAEIGGVGSVMGGIEERETVRGVTGRAGG